MTKTQYRQFSGEEIISDILLEFPEAHEILAAHGIACAGCHINQYETLKDGVIAHYGEDLFWVVIKDLNEAAIELKLALDGERKTTDPEITESAKTKILEFQKEAGKEGFGLRIEVTLNPGSEPNYFLDFEEKPERGDRLIEDKGIKIFCDPDSYRFLQNKRVNYVLLDGEEGFKFESV